MAIMSFEIGTTYAGLANVETFTTIPNMAPASKFFDYSESVPTGDGGRATRGAPSAVWTWGYIPDEMFNSLRALCPGGSAAMYIRTLQDDYSTYAYYTCQMIWPELTEYEYRSGKYQTFSIRFQRLVAYVP